MPEIIMLIIIAQIIRKPGKFSARQIMTKNKTDTAIAVSAQKFTICDSELFFAQETGVANLFAPLQELFFEKLLKNVILRHSLPKNY